MPDKKAVLLSIILLGGWCWGQTPQVYSGHASGSGTITIQGASTLSSSSVQVVKASRTVKPLTADELKKGNYG